MFRFLMTKSITNRYKKSVVFIKADIAISY